MNHTHSSPIEINVNGKTQSLEVLTSLLDGGASKTAEEWMLYLEDKPARLITAPEYWGIIKTLYDEPKSNRYADLRGFFREQLSTNTLTSGTAIHYEKQTDTIIDGFDGKTPQERKARVAGYGTFYLQENQNKKNQEILNILFQTQAKNIPEAIRWLTNEVAIQISGFDEPVEYKQKRLVTFGNDDPHLKKMTISTYSLDWTSHQAIGVRD